MKVKLRGLILANTVLFALIFVLGAAVLLPFAERPETLPAFGMEELNSTDPNGDVMIVNAFASRCPPCRAEGPHLLKPAREHGIVSSQILSLT